MATVTWETAKQGELTYTPESFRHLLRWLHHENVLGGVRVDIGCGPEPVTDAWYEDRSLGEVAWMDPVVVESIRRYQQARQLGYEPPPHFQRVLVDKDEDVERLRFKSDAPSVVHTRLEHLMAHECIEYLLASCPSPMATAKLRGIATRKKHEYRDALEDACDLTGEYGVNTIVAASVCNYMMWQPVIGTLEQDVLPGGLVVLTNHTDVGVRADMNRVYKPESNVEIVDFFARDLGHRIVLATEEGGQLYLVTQKR